MYRGMVSSSEEGLMGKGGNGRKFNLRRVCIGEGVNRDKKTS